MAILCHVSNVMLTPFIKCKNLTQTVDLVVRMSPERVDRLTYCHADPGTGDGQADIVGEGHVDAEDAGLVEELPEDHLALRSGCHSGAHRLDRCGAVFV